MHQILIVTPCSYMHAGLRALMGMAREPAEVRQISRPEEIPPEAGGQGTRLVLVPVPRNEPRVAAQARVYLWRQSLLQLTGELPVLPCVLLSNGRGREYRTLPEHLPAEMLREVLSEILAHPEKAVRRMPPKKTSRELSPLQAKILAGTLAGESVEEMAEKMEMTQRGVFAGRAALLNKLGLNNRLGLLTLTEAELA